MIGIFQNFIILKTNFFENFKTLPQKLTSLQRNRGLLEVYYFAIYFDNDYVCFL